MVTSRTPYLATKWRPKLKNGRQSPTKIQYAKSRKPLCRNRFFNYTQRYKTAVMPLVRMRSAVRIRPAAPNESLRRKSGAFHLGLRMRSLSSQRKSAQQLQKLRLYVGAFSFFIRQSQTASFLLILAQRLRSDYEKVTFFEQLQMVGVRLVGKIFHNIPHFAVKNAAKGVDGMCADTFVSL